MADSLRFFIVDDDPDMIQLETALLEMAGHQVESTSDSTQAVDLISKAKPDCVVLDIMMPGMDGLEVCQRLREIPELDATPIVVVSSKAYDYDKKRAMDLGANGFINKKTDLPDAFLDKIEKVIDDPVELRFWGVRGTLPVPGEGSVRYGGNTSCVTLEFAKGQFLIFDAGTGIKELSNWLLKSGRGQRLEAKILISHPHWDHINALPFFVPLYIQGGDFEIMGPTQSGVHMEEIISNQMDGVYFPIKIQEFGARVYFRDLKEETFMVGDVEVRTMLLSHPGNCLGYRVNYKGRSICYITDNELYPPDTDWYDIRYLNQLADFCRDTDVLITDSTYFDEEYDSKVHWGHSRLTEVVELAHRAQAKALYLFHHDPDQNDDDIDRKQAVCEEMLQHMGSNTKVVAPKEGDLVKM